MPIYETKTRFFMRSKWIVLIALLPLLLPAGSLAGQYVGGATGQEIDRLSGVRENVQEQLDSKQQTCENPLASAPASPYDGQEACADGANWSPGSTDQGTDVWIVRWCAACNGGSGRWLGVYNVTDGVWIEKPRSLAMADLVDTTSPHVLTVSETTDTIISNYAASGADRIFTVTAHPGFATIFAIGDEYQVDVEPASGERFRFNGALMGIDEHIQNTADTLGERMVCYNVVENGTNRIWCFSSNSNWVQETP